MFEDMFAGWKRHLLWIATGALLVGLNLPTDASAAATLKGTFIVVHAHKHMGEHYGYYLDTGDRRYRLRLPRKPKVRPSQPVTVTGNVSGNNVDVQSVTATGPPEPANASGTHSVLVLMVHYSPTDGTTSSQAQTQIGTTDNRWYQGTSYGQLGLTATATPWMAIPDSSNNGTDCNYNQILLDAEAAATRLGYVPADYDHEMIYFPVGTPGCDDYAGLAEVSGRISWIFGGYMQTYVTVHELGHNLSLGHSHSLTCHGARNAYVTLSSNCDPFSEYGDLWDAMGCCDAGQFNPIQKNHLGWMSGRVATQSSGTQTHSIFPLESSPVAIRAVKIDTAGEDYWLSYRQPLGEDSYLSSYPEVTRGVQIHIAAPRPNGTYGTHLLDGTPNGTFYDPVLEIGRSWTTPEGVTVTINSASSSAASVTVDFAANCTVTGTSGDDILYSTSKSERICGLGGDDIVSYADSPNGVTANLSTRTATGHGTDTLVGIEGLQGSPFVDSLDGDQNPNYITGAQGNDKVAGHENDDTLHGGEGNDRIYLEEGNDAGDGGVGVDTLVFYRTAVSVDLSSGTATGEGADTFSNIENVTGSPYADSIDGNAGVNILSGGGGDDKVAGHEGNDTVKGDAGNDRVYLEAGNDLGNGGAGVDTIIFYQAAVRVDLSLGTASGEGSDRFSAIENVTGSSWNDSIRGNGAGNSIKGLEGIDTIYGLGAADQLLGGLGDDYLSGGDGNDYLNGEDGRDTCIQGAGTGSRLNCER